MHGQPHISPFSIVVTLLRICCEMCHSVALWKPYFCFFLFLFFFGIRTILRRQFWRVIWVFKGWCLCGPESNCREDCLGRRIILMYNLLFFSAKYYQVFLDEYLVLNTPKYERRMLDGLFRGVIVCRLWYLFVSYSEVPQFPLATLPSCFWFMLEASRFVIGHCLSKRLAASKNLTECSYQIFLFLVVTNKSLCSTATTT